MSIFGSKELEGVEGFEDALKNHIEAQKAAFIQSYRNRKEKLRGAFTKGTTFNEHNLGKALADIEQAYQNIKQDDIETYNILGLMLATLDEILLNAGSLKPSDGGGDIGQRGYEVGKLLQRLRRQFPDEYSFLRRKMIQRINKGYGAVAGTNLNTDLFFKPILKELAQPIQGADVQGSDNPENLDSFKDIVKRKAENERNEFILGYREEKTHLNATATPEVFTEYSLMNHLKHARDLLYEISWTNKESYTMRRGENVRKYYTLGRIFALMDDIAQRAPSVTFEKGGSASQGGEFAAEELTRIEKGYPVEYAFIRRKLIQRLNKSYKPTMGRNPQIDALFMPIIKKLTQEPKQA